MTKRFGQDWAGEFTSAHEGYHGNPGPAEAMDLYNNEVGRRIAVENPSASEKDLAGLIEQAVRDGNLTTIGEDKKLRWSADAGPHPSADGFSEHGSESLPGRPRSDFGIQDRPELLARSKMWLL